MRINIEIDNKILDSVMKDTIGAIEKVCEEEFKKCCYEIVRDAKTLCPVDTGRLRNSINAEFSQTNGVWHAAIGSDVEYAYWVENGHGVASKNEEGEWTFSSFVPGQPFLRTAIRQNKDFMKKYLDEKISKALGGSSL